jgi:hypothetical protein
MMSRIAKWGNSQGLGIDWFLQDYERPETNEWEKYDEPKGREVW